jgi:hypothetical protein
MTSEIPDFSSTEYLLNGIKFRHYEIDNDYHGWKFNCPKNNKKILIFKHDYDYSKMDEYEDQEKFYSENFPDKHYVHISKWTKYENSCLDYSYTTDILEFDVYTEDSEMLEGYKLYIMENPEFKKFFSDNDKTKTLEITEDWNSDFITEIDFQTYTVFNVKKKLSEILDREFPGSKLEKNMRMNNYIIEIGDFFSPDNVENEAVREFISKFVEFKLLSLKLLTYNQDTSVYKSILEIAEFVNAEQKVENTKVHHDWKHIQKFKNPQNTKNFLENQNIVESIEYKYECDGEIIDYRYCVIKKKEIQKNMQNRNRIMLIDSDLFDRELGIQVMHKIHFRSWENIMLSDIAADTKSEYLHVIEIADKVSDFDMVNIYRHFIQQKFGDLYKDFPEIDSLNFDEDLLSSDIIYINIETKDVNNK